MRIRTADLRITNFEKAIIGYLPQPGDVPIISLTIRISPQFHALGYSSLFVTFFGFLGWLVT
jgi:hypothetical protein